MPSDPELARFAHRNEAAGRGPIEDFVMEPLPPNITRAFPELKDWEKRENARRAEFVKRLNTREATA